MPRRSEVIAFRSTGTRRHSSNSLRSDRDRLLISRWNIGVSRRLCGKGCHHDHEQYHRRGPNPARPRQSGETSLHQPTPTVAGVEHVESGFGCHCSGIHRDPRRGVRSIGQTCSETSSPLNAPFAQASFKTYQNRLALVCPRTTKLPMPNTRKMSLTQDLVDLCFRVEPEAARPADSAALGR